MRTAPRYYLIADDGKIHRLARATFYKLLEQKIPTPVPEFNGKRVRLATVNVRLDGRRAVAVARASYTFITFDANGFFDSTEWDAATAATIETWTIPTQSSTSPEVDARALRRPPLRARTDVATFRRSPAPTIRERYGRSRDLPLVANQLLSIDPAAGSTLHAIHHRTFRVNTPSAIACGTSCRTPPLSSHLPG